MDNTRRGPWWGALLALATTQGCADCQEWDAVPIQDPTDVAGDDQEAAAQAGLDDMAEWTAREETCVRRVRFVDRLRTRGFDLPGDYRPQSRRIRLARDRARPMGSTTTASS